MNLLPDLAGRLFQTGASQGGYFTAAQHQAAGRAAMLVGLLMLWLGVKETTEAMPPVFRVPLVVGGAAGMAGIVWWMARPR